MINRGLFIKTKIGLTSKALEELSKIVENQNTTDKEEAGEYIYTDENDIQYFYTIDEDYDVILTDIKY